MKASVPIICKCCVQSLNLFYSRRWPSKQKIWRFPSRSLQESWMNYERNSRGKPASDQVWKSRTTRYWRGLRRWKWSWKRKGVRYVYLKFIYTERKRFFLRSLSLLSVNIKLDSLWTHLEVISLSLLRQYKRILTVVRAHLHQASASTLRQLCDDACDSVLIENNGVKNGVATIFKWLHWFQWEQNLKSNRRVVAVWTLTLGVNRP